MSDSLMPPDNWKTINFLLKELREDSKESKESISNITGSLIRLETDLGHIKEDNKEQITQIAKVASLHYDCQARRDIKSVNARLTKLEQRNNEEMKERIRRAEDISTHIDTFAQREEALRIDSLLTNTKKKDKESLLIKIFFNKTVLGILLAAILGVALGSIAVAKMFGYIEVPKVQSKK